VKGKITMLGHRITFSLALGIAGLLCSAGLGACGKPSPKSALAAEMDGLPQWALGKCEAGLKNKSALCGSGSVQGMSSVSLARSAAEGRARTELARVLQVRVKSMLKDYQSAAQGGPDNETASEQYIEDTSKQISDVTLSGSRLEETFVSDTGTFWALVVLDVEAFKGSLQQASALNDQVRAAIIARADHSFQQLDEATAPRSGAIAPHP
jgi:LPP20 lipoprotein